MLLNKQVTDHVFKKSYHVPYDVIPSTSLWEFSGYKFKIITIKCG